MENAVDALKMAAAALIFVVALSVAILTFTKAREAATAVLAKSDAEYYNTENIKVTKDRIVGIETIIPTLYSYFKEGYTILFYDGSDVWDEENQKLTGEIRPLTLYYTEAQGEYLPSSKLLSDVDNTYKSTYNEKNYSRAVYGFDWEDEMKREEPWRGNENTAKEFIKSFIKSENSPRLCLVK